MNTIRLDCGLELEPGIKWLAEGPEVFDGETAWSADLCDGSLQVMISTAHNGAIIDVMCGQRWADGITTLDEAKSWLSARVVELVSSLGAVIVPGDAREVAAQAVYDSFPKQDGTFGKRPKWDEFKDGPDAKWYYRTGDHVLAALGMVQR